MPVIVSPTSRLLFAAIQAKLDPASIRELVTLQREEESLQAERLFNQAIAEFQGLCPVIDKDSEADAGKYTYRFASLGHIVDVIKEPLKRCGLTYTWDSNVEDNAISVICTIHHVAGHSRSATFRSPIDKGSRMNSMQQGASALSYARRFALQLALGIVTADTDDDARGCDGDPEPQPRTEVSQKAVDQLRAELTIKGLTSSQIDEWIGLELKMNPELHKDASNWTKADMDRCRAKWRKCYPKESN